MTPTNAEHLKLYMPGRTGKLRIVAIGGGHGLSNMLRGLKHVTKHLTAIVAVSDDGGGSGVLRKELGILPPGDIRNCMLALSNAEPMLEQMLDYRFQDGNLSGQSFGNLFLAALTGVCGNFEMAVKRMSDILAITGTVLPVSAADVNLEAEFENGETVLGESSIFYAKKANDCRIRQVHLVPAHPPALPETLEAIRNADLIILGPGSLYTSVIPNLLVDGIADELARAPAVKLYVANIMTQDGETEGYTAADHVRALLRHSSSELLDAVLANDAPVPGHLRSVYATEGAEPIRLCREEIEEMGIRVYTAPLLAQGTYARHDPLLLANALTDVYRQERSRR